MWTHYTLYNTYFVIVHCFSLLVWSYYNNYSGPIYLYNSYHAQPMFICVQHSFINMWACLFKHALSNINELYMLSYVKLMLLSCWLVGWCSKKKRNENNDRAKHNSSIFVNILIASRQNRNIMLCRIRPGSDPIILNK